MSEIKAILLVPAEGDPHGLLREGPCGARPPMAVEGSESWSACPWYPECGAIRASLVLAWDGKPVREGCYRVADTNNVTPTAVPGAIKCALEGDPILRSISELGTIVLLDADGKEIK